MGILTNPKRLLIAAMLISGLAAGAWANEEQHCFKPCTLVPGESLTIGRVELSFQTDGNLVLRQDPGTTRQTILWKTSLKERHGDLVATFGESGDLALLEAGTAYWHANTKGSRGDQLVLSTRPPYLTIRAGGGELKWVARTPLFFLAPNTFFFQKANKPGVAADKPELQSLFTDPKSWKRARRHINVFQIYAQTVDANSVSELATMFTFLRAHGIALAMEAGVINGEKAGCGKAVEGYGGERIADLAAKIKQAGGDLAYIAIDESFINGHYNPKGCLLDPNSLAINVLKAYAAAKTSFPAVQFGDIENLPGEVSSDSKDYMTNFAAWYHTLNAGMDVPLAFFHLDADWTKTAWDGGIATMQALLQEGGTPFGVIVNGKNDAKSAAEWSRSNREIIQTIKASKAGPFDQLIFQSWNPYPAVLTPEDDPDSLVSSVNFYFGEEHLSR